MNVDDQPQDIDIALLRARVEAAARQARAAELRAARRGQLLEKLLKAVNGPTYHYLSIQLAPDQEVADILTDNEQHILDYFLVPLDEWAQAAADPACRGSLQQVSPVWRAIGAARARELAEQGAEGSALALPEGPPPSQAQTARDERTKFTASLQAETTDSPEQEGESATPGGEEGTPAKRPGATSPERDQVVTRARHEVTPAQGGTPPDAQVTLDDESSAIIQELGTGNFLAYQVLEQVAVHHGTTMDKRKQRLYEKLDALERAGLVGRQPIKLHIANKLLKGLGQLAIALTEAGQARYRALCGEEPVDGIGPFKAKYKTLEAGLLIRVVKRILDRWNERGGRHWTYEVIDAVWEPDEAFAQIPGAQRSYATADGTRRVLPDLIVQMRPPSGEPQLAVIEVERGAYKVADLRDKWERAVLCYPPRMLYVVAPNAKTRNWLYSEWRTVVTRAAERHGISHDVAAAFYTPLELEEYGLFSAKQFTGLMYAQRAARKKEEARQDVLSVEEKRLLRLPKFWNQAKTVRREGA